MPILSNETKLVFRQLLYILSPTESRKLVTISGLAVIAAAAEALSIGLVFPFMSLLTNPELVVSHPITSTLFNGTGEINAGKLATLGSIALIIVFTLKNLFLLALYAFQAHFVCNLESRIGVELLQSYLTAPFSERLAKNSSDRIRVITNEVGRVTVGVIQSFITVLSETLVVIAIASLLLIAQPLIAVVAILVIGVVGILMQTVFRKSLDSHRASRVETLKAMYRWATEGLGAIKEIKALEREAYVVDEFRKNSRAYARDTYVFNTLIILPRIALEATAISILAISVIISLEAGMSLPSIVPALTIFALAAVRLMPSASRLISSLSTISYYIPAVNTVATDLKSLDEPLKRPSGPVQKLRGEAPFKSLHLNGISYSYPESNTPILSNINLHIKRGEAIAVIGRSGSGKSTLGDILLGLLKPDTGSIVINDERTVFSLRGEWTGTVGLVPQEFFLIDDSIRRNVAFGLPDDKIDNMRVWKSLGLAQLEQRVRELPNQLENSVGERGGILSGGERQRLGIARALYTDPDILVLDEATSALDSATEIEVLRVLQSLKNEKTIIFITHRLESVAWCDRVIKIENGRIVLNGFSSGLKESRDDS
ncbi:MAG: ABC transporter ATP-binding protein [Steroidobacteraceae bacterium]